MQRQNTTLKIAFVPSRKILPRALTNVWTRTFNKETRDGSYFPKRFVLFYIRCERVCENSLTHAATFSVGECCARGLINLPGRRIDTQSACNQQSVVLIYSRALLYKHELLCFKSLRANDKFTLLIGELHADSVN